jgi:formylglycine-generating enzyme required for sulfatase activity
MGGRSLGRSGWLVVAALLVASAGLAQEKGEKYALLVGVRRYDPNELRSLPYSEADATELAAVLKASGYQPDNVVLMTQAAGAEDPRFTPVAGQIRKELKLLLRDLGPDDRMLVALAGHGVQFVGDPESYFCPADARLADKSTLIPLGEVYKDLEACGAGMKVLLVDACRNDPQSDNSRALAVVNLQSVTRPMMPKAPGGVVAFFSCSEGEKAFEHADLKHGVFFHFVIEGLRGAAVGAEEREVLMPDLEKFVKRRVRDFVRAKYGVRQMPELKGTTRDLVPLVSLDRARIKLPEAPRPSPVREDAQRQNITNTIGMKLALIAPGTFLMGSTADDKEAYDNEKPQHEVRITRPFYLGVHEVTQAQYEAVMGQNPSWFSSNGEGKDQVADQSTDHHPVERVSWLDAVTFCNKLSAKEGLKPFYEIAGETVRVPDGKEPGYRLPTEAEWEYACRAGTRTRYSFGDDAAGLGESSWYKANSQSKTHPVGQKQANTLGLFDMHGNVWEWCGDVYEYYRSPPPGIAPLGVDRVKRGGSLYDEPRYLRAASRSRNAPDNRSSTLGFRAARGQSGR